VTRRANNRKTTEREPGPTRGADKLVLLLVVCSSSDEFDIDIL
jgi:hypothetical protein